MAIRITYYPGCSLHTRARGLNASAIEALKLLGVELDEMERWNCCGAVFPQTVDNLMLLAGSARNLADAREKGDSLTTTCSACYNVLKRTNRFLREHADKKDTLNFFIEKTYEGDLKVFHLLEVLRDNVGFANITKAVKKDLSCLKVAPYYGCQLLRPPKEMEFDDPEDPAILHDFVRSLKAEAVSFPMMNECCGYYQDIPAKDVCAELSRKITESARSRAADVIVVSCPMCQYNLDSSQAQIMEQNRNLRPIPVLYFTQLLAIALGLSEGSLFLEDSAVSPLAVLRERNLLQGA